ncbi:MAG: DUF192 domain-containing protein [Planctomycetota bacterium]|jgi:uncharacterized membrane protein (UPF0127 family)
MNWKKHIVTFLVLFFLVGMVLFGTRGACAPAGGRGAGRPPEARVLELKVAGAPPSEERLSVRSYAIRAELAETEEKRKRGLSGRGGLEPGYGMLYVYRKPLRPEFSESGTPFPLSVAFIDGEGTVVEVRRTEKNDPDTFSPRQPVEYVLEVRAGWFEDRALGPGTRLLIPADVHDGAKPYAAGAETPVLNDEAAGAPPPEEPS